MMKKKKVYPKTSAPSPGQFLKAYKKALLENDKILVIVLSSKLSGTLNSAISARNLLPNPEKVEIVDSFSAVAAEGLLVLKTIELIKKGKDLQEIKKFLNSFKKDIKVVAFLKTTYWVEKIGRITKKMAFGFKFLKAVGIMPIIGFKKGEVGIVGFNFLTTKIEKAIFHQLKKEAKKSNSPSTKIA